ncbi:MAG: TonB-dependent receptor [Bacteroidota bacterium]|nr:TonB-dependent receptor [Bacteroidota bacterium]
MKIITQKVLMKKRITEVIRMLKILPFLFLFPILSVVSTNSYAVSSSKLLVKFKVSGTVVSAKSSEPLIGASVKEKGNNNNAAITDINGGFTITLSSPTAILEVSYIGFEKQEVPVENRNQITIRLVESEKTLDEVVVVAFGTQKRTDLVGSVTSIKMSDLKVPASNLTQALAGRVAGVIAYQRSGEPGQDNADFFIRGVTTFGYKTSPLILIDGMESTTKDLARLTPEDIESFSIMKDATSTALYGARGANGVILVSTKQGKEGKAKFSFRVENSFSSPTQNVQLADPVTYMKMSNEAILTRNPLGVVLYSDEKIANTAAELNPSNENISINPTLQSIIYPANDWKKIMFKNYTSVQRATLNVSGGGDIAKYFVSGSFDKDNGIMKVDKRNNFNNNIDLKTYTLRSNVTINVTKTTEMIVRLSGTFDDYQGPIDGGAAMYTKVMKANPVLFPAYYPVNEQYKYVNHILFGNYDVGQYINPYADMTKGYKDYSNSLMVAQLEAKQDLSFITKGLSVRAMMNTNRSSYFDVSRYYNPYYYTLSSYDLTQGTYQLSALNDATGTEYLGYSEGTKTLTSSFYMESMLNYNNTFNKKHNLSGLLVYMMRNQLNANAGDLQQSLPFRNLGVSGRATYAYDNRYFLEFNFGYNGSERFYKTKRFGFFPSAGLAWSISNEKFFKPYKDVVTNLRLRTTYGLIGNDEIGSATDRFFYLSNLNMNNSSMGATFGRDPGGYSLNGISISRYSNEGITWETSKQKNVALEVGLFSKLNLQAEYYTQTRDHILMTRASIPVTMGFTAPIRANVGKASGKGVDLSLDYAEAFRNGFSFSVRGNFTYATSKYLVYEEPQYAESYRSHVGKSLYQQYGYIAERLFIDDADAANSPKQNFGTYGGGDIKYLDVNRDGEITAADMVPIGNPTLPEITYGFGFSTSYKAFDFSAFFQGLANESFWIDPVATSPFQGQTQVLKAYADSYWSEDHRDIYALWPRLSPTVNSNNTQTSTWFMRDGSFLRLKQVELGFTVPRKIQNRIHTSDLRFYVNGTNLLNFSKFKLWDVEMGGNGLGYPIQKVINFGINLNFN